MLAFASFSARFAAPLALACSAGVACAQFTSTTLSSNQAGVGTNQNTSLTNGWGVTSGPTGNIFLSSAGGFNGLQFNGLGASQASNNIAIPGATAGSQGSPTGVAFSGASGNNFMVNGAPANFLFATSNGTIAGWNSGASATTLVNNASTGASYTGLGVANSSGGSGGRLFAADFANGSVRAFNNSFAPITTATFTDPTLPSGYSPYNVGVFNNQVFVTYAQRNSTTGQPIAGAGNGVIDVYDLNGNFQSRFASGGQLNAPWGLAMAPSNFGPYSNSLLVGNYGSGTISAYNPTTGAYLGQLMGANNQPIMINGLYGLSFGNGGANQASNTLFFSAGPNNGTNGAFGSIVVPTPGVAAALGLSALAGLRRRR